MSIGGERSAVQNPFLKYASEVGWTYLSPQETFSYRRGVTSPVLDAILVEQLQRLNPDVMNLQRAEQIRDQLVRVRPNIEGNLDAWKYIKGLKTAFVEAEKRERNIRLFDPIEVETNAFHITDEYTFSNGTPPDVRIDIVLFVNGLPVIVGETKSAKEIDGISKAFDDICYYHRKAPELLALPQIHGISDLIHFLYGATWNLSRKGLFSWRDEQAGKYETLVKTFVEPRRVLRAITEYILFTRTDGELTKVVLRPHQMRAVERCVQRAQDPVRRRGLVWHTQGSGKTYTMITVAKQLIQNPGLQNPTVLMLVDRNELEQQLYGNLESVGFGHLEVAQSKQHLRDLLHADRRGLIVSMIHKFDDIPQDINTRRNIFVLVDEAHRSTGADLGNYLMGALPNATYLGFTGTPIDQTAYGGGTFKVFGIDDEKGYLDKYPIRESVADGTTVPLHYQIAPSELRVKRDVLENEFLDLAETQGISDVEDLNKVLESAVTLKNMMKSSERVDKVAEYVAKHYLSTIEPMGYKAFLVAVDREACALYKDALDRYLPSEYSEVVISTQGKADLPILQRFYRSEEDEKSLRKRFRKPDEQPKILIVTEKLLTGFDAPILYCMYLDKPMRDHVLLQAIARVNRPYEDKSGRRKPCGFVVDFVGIFERLERALAFDSKDVEGVIEDIAVLKRRFQQLMELVRREYLQVTTGKTGDKAVEAALEHFRNDERRHQFYTDFHEVQTLYEIISPDAFLRPFLRIIQELTNMYQVIRNCYESGLLVDRDLLRKTAQLIRETTETGPIRASEYVHTIGTESLEAIALKNQPDTVKVFNLSKAFEVEVARNADREPYLISIGDRAQEIADAFKQGHETAQTALGRFRDLIQELNQAKQERVNSQLSSEAFAVYWLLKTDGIDQADVVAKAADRAFRENPHWQSSSHQQRDVLQMLYKALVSAGVRKDRITNLAQRIMTMLTRVGP